MKRKYGLGIKPENGGHVLEYFLKIGDRAKAISLLNSEYLSFSDLFKLIPLIKASSLYEELNPKLITALKICAKVLNDRELAAYVGEFEYENSEELKKTLRWMFITGTAWDGPESGYDEYDSLMDAVFSLLINLFHDTYVFEEAAELIFRRNRKELFINDLTGSYFKSRSTEALKYISRYLLSPNESDVDLACRLLHIHVPEHPVSNRQKRTHYNQFVSWLKENGPYLYFSGENMHSSSEPAPLSVNWEAKYLSKNVSGENGALLEPLDAVQESALVKYRRLTADDQVLLSSYSARVKKANPRRWQEWIKNDLDEQLRVARSDRSVRL